MADINERVKTFSDFGLSDGEAKTAALVERIFFNAYLAKTTDSQIAAAVLTQALVRALVK